MGALTEEPRDSKEQRGSKFGGAKGDRTPDLMTASHALSQLSYGPNRCVILNIYVIGVNTFVGRRSGSRLHPISPAEAQDESDHSRNQGQHENFSQAGHERYILSPEASKLGLIKRK